MDIENLQCVIEAMLFASGDPILPETISQILELDKKTVILLINRLKDNLDSQNRGITIREINGAYTLCSKEQYYDYIVKLFEPKQKQGLSQAALETLAIVAYKQPISRMEIEKIRGVSCDRALYTLAEHNLIEETGRLDVPGRPIIYGTTTEFLKAFGYSKLADMPIIDLEDKTIDEGQQISEESK